MDEIFKLGASAAAAELFERIENDIDANIPHGKYEVKLHSSPWFTAT